MNVLTKVADFFTGGIGETILDGVKAYFPPSMTDTEKATMELAIKEETRKATEAANKAWAEERQQLTDRIKSLEGTASDLLQAGWLGRIILFFRGCQRPVWGFATLYMDACYFSGKWGEFTAQQESAIYLINALVLGFLVGERALTNAWPVGEKMMDRKAEKKTSTN